MENDLPGQERDALQAGLDRWVRAGLVTEDQATAIAAFESGGAPSAPGDAPDRRRARSVEALGYVGGAVVAAALVVLAVGYWDRIDRAWQLTIPAVAAVALLGAGLAAGGLARAGSVEASARLRAVLWLGSSAATAAFLGVLIDTWGVRERWGMPILAGGLLAQAVPLWLAHRRAPQQLAVFVGAMMVAAAVAAQLREAWPDSWDVTLGLVMAVVALGWACAAWRAPLPVATASAQRRWGLCLGIAGTSVAATVLAASGQAPWLGVAGAAAALALALAAGDLATLGISAVGTMIVLPLVIDHYLDSTVLTALTLLVAGLALVALALVVARRGRRSRSVTG